MNDLRDQIVDILHENWFTNPNKCAYELADAIALLMQKKECMTEVPCSTGLDTVREVVGDIRKSDCGAWLKDCNGIHHCSEGREKRQELMRLLDKLYKAASI